jgi:hypothetical protein
MSVGFRRVVFGEFGFLFLGRVSLIGLEFCLGGKSMLVVVRRSVLVVGANTVEAEEAGQQTRKKE